MAFVDRATDVLSRLRAELSLPLSSRRTGASGAQLQFAAQRIADMKREVESGTLPAKKFRYPDLGRAIVDGWALGSPLGMAVIELENECRAL